MKVPTNAEIELKLDGRARTKGQAAASLKVAGRSWDEIAVILDFKDVGACRKAGMAAFAEAATDEEKDHVRQLASARYEKLLAAVMPAALDPEGDNHIASQRQARELTDRLVVLWGAAAPQEMIVTSPTVVELQRFVSELISKSAPDVEESDPFASRALTDGTNSEPVDAELVDEPWG